MNKSDVIYLISESYHQNEYGVMEKTTDRRKVFCKVSSVSGQEWFEGGRNGLNPQYRFTMFSHDYQNEQIIEYHDTLYAIYRVFFKSVDQIELYTELRKGSYENQD